MTSSEKARAWAEKAEALRPNADDTETNWDDFTTASDLAKTWAQVALAESVDGYTYYDRKRQNKLVDEEPNLTNEEVADARLRRLGLINIDSPTLPPVDRLRCVQHGTLASEHEVHPGAWNNDNLGPSS